MLQISYDYNSPHVWNLSGKSRDHKFKRPSCAEIREVVDLKLSSFLVRTIDNIHLKFHIDNLLNFETGVF